MLRELGAEGDDLYVKGHHPKLLKGRVEIAAGPVVSADDVEVAINRNSKHP